MTYAWFTDGLGKHSKTFYTKAPDEATAARWCAAWETHEHKTGIGYGHRPPRPKNRNAGPSTEVPMHIEPIAYD